MTFDPQLWRKQFPIVQNKTYLISHSLGAMPQRAHIYLQQFVEEWSGQGLKAWEEGWWDMPVRLGDAIAEFSRHEETW